MAKPFIKWAGGKRKLAAQIIEHFGDLSKFSNYYEPFVGAGAVFFELAARVDNYVFHLSDVNEELINCYEVIRDTPNRLINFLRDEERFANTREAFTSVRDWKPTNRVMRAARFIYLNKTCFNGLYRVNRSGEFNVPFGKMKNPNICDEATIREAAEELFLANIHCRSFEQLTAKTRSIFYFDPPYVPKSGAADFTAYDKAPFGEREQERLRDHAASLVKAGHRVVLSNSDTPLVRMLYSNEKVWKLHPIKAARAISCTGDRTDADEFIIVGKS